MDTRRYGTRARMRPSTPSAVYSVHDPLPEYGGTCWTVKIERDSDNTFKVYIPLETSTRPQYIFPATQLATYGSPHFSILSVKSLSCISHLLLLLFSPPPCQPDGSICMTMPTSRAPSVKRIRAMRTAVYHPLATSTRQILTKSREFERQR